MSNTLKAIIFIIGCTIGLGGCGGGGGSASAPTSGQAIDGIWSGTITSNVLGITVGEIGIVSPNNELHFLSSQGVQITGFGTVSGNNFSATATAFAPAGLVFPDGSTVAPSVINGTAVAGSSLNGTFSGGGDSGTFSLTFDPVYNRGASLSVIAGTWSGGISNGAFLTITIDQLGNIGGSDTSGCVFNGIVSIIDPQKNVYKSSVTVTGCAGSIGTVTGLGALSDNPPSQNNILNFGMSNSIATVSGKLFR